MSFQLSGLIHHIGEIEERGNFKFRQVILQVDDGSRYTQYVAFQFSQARADLPESRNVGERVTIEFNIRGKESAGRYYNTLDAWKIE